MRNRFLGSGFFKFSKRHEARSSPRNLTQKALLKTQLNFAEREAQQKQNR